MSMATLTVPMNGPVIIIDDGLSCTDRPDLTRGNPLCGQPGRRLHIVFTTKLVDAAGRINQLLLSGEEGVTL